MRITASEPVAVHLLPPILLALPAIGQGFVAMGTPVLREAFALRSDDLLVQWQAVRAGLGVGFFTDYQARTDPEVLPVLQCATLQAHPFEHRTQHASRADVPTLVCCL